MFPYTLTKDLCHMTLICFPGSQPCGAQELLPKLFSSITAFWPAGELRSKPNCSSVLRSWFSLTSVSFACGVLKPLILILSRNSWVKAVIILPVKSRYSSWIPKNLGYSAWGTLVDSVDPSKKPRHHPNKTAVQSCMLPRWEWVRILPRPAEGALLQEANPRGWSKTRTMLFL